MSERSQFQPCPDCGHVHGPPFDYCRYPVDVEKAERSVADGGGYLACGCTKQ